MEIIFLDILQPRGCVMKKYDANTKPKKTNQSVLTHAPTNIKKKKYPNVNRKKKQKEMFHQRKENQQNCET